jgi:hypothetical protein
MYKHMKVRKTFTEFSVDITVGDVPEETPCLGVETATEK